MNAFVNRVSERDFFAANAPEWVEGNPTWGDICAFVGLKPGTDIRNWKNEYTMAYKAAKRYEWADAMLQARERK